MKRVNIYIAIFLFFFLPTELKSQNFDDEFNAFVKQSQQSFLQFEDSINIAFAKAMLENMCAIEIEPAKELVRKPKPTIPEKYVPVEKTAETIQVQKEEDAQSKPEGEKRKQEELPQELDTVNISLSADVEREQTIELQFSNLQSETWFHLDEIKAENVANIWANLSRMNFGDFIRCCQVKQSDCHYNDWALCQYVFQSINENFSETYNEQVILAVFILNQIGIEAKIGFAPSHLFCLVAIQQQIYGIQYSQINGRNYYFFELNPAAPVEEDVSYRSYSNSFPKATRSLDMNIYQPIKFDKKITKGTAAQKDRNNIQVDKDMIDFFATYPQVDLEVYANAVTSKKFAESVENVLGEQIKGLSQIDAVNFLLKYVQFEFDYSTDIEQFGREKPFFAEECYFYKYSDCEDRSVLFSFLIRALLKMDVVLVDYPGHVATAVNFVGAEDMSGSAVQYQGKKYIICDPTFIGAPIGVECPELIHQNRTIIPLKKINYQY